MNSNSWEGASRVAVLDAAADQERDMDNAHSRGEDVSEGLGEGGNGKEREKGEEMRWAMQSTALCSHRWGW